jgi:altronate dehydratase large subunit
MYALTFVKIQAMVPNSNEPIGMPGGTGVGKSRTPTFEGYARPDGRAGVRNHVLVLSINGLSNRAAERIATAVPGVVLVTTPYGRGQYGDDKTLHRSQLVGLARNPNVAAVLIIGVDRPTADDVAGAVSLGGKSLGGKSLGGKPVEVLTLDDTHEDALALSTLGIRAAGRLLRDASRQRRSIQPASALFLGVECGHSDATSGVAANPVAGSCVDRLVDSGGTAVIGEAIEWLGAERLVAQRANSVMVGKAIMKAVLRRETLLVDAHIDLTGNNPGAENIRGGLSTIEEKSLGAIAKTGTRPIVGLLGHAEAPGRKGLHLMDGPSFSPESLTGFAAAGAQIMLFTTGPGNSFCNRLAPTIKITGRSDTATRLDDQIDFDAGPVLAGTETVEAAGERLFRHVLATASGLLTFGEVHGEGAEAFTRAGPSM